MTQIERKKLDSGDLFPKMELRLTDGSSMVLPDMLKDNWSILLVYRGRWWPFCNQQLADFQSRIGEYEERKIKIVAASADKHEEAQKIIERRKLTFPIAYGLDAKEFAAMTGAFFDANGGFLHATGFILKPDSTISEAVYSTGPIGRFTAPDSLLLIDFLSKKSS